MSAAGALSSNSNVLPMDRRAAQQPDDPGQGDSLQDYAEYITLDGPAPENEIAPDGSLIVYLGDAAEEVTPEDGEFFSNLAEVLPPNVLSTIATDLLLKIEEDKEARKKRTEQYAEGIKRTGLGKDAPGGAEFEGASRAVHPGLTEACIDYQSRIMKELWPPSGPAKPKINGVVTTEKTDRAKRKTDYLNWQLTTQITEARDTFEKNFSQVPLGGSQFIKLWHDPRLKRPRVQFVSIDKCILPADAVSWASSHRRTFEDSISGVEMKLRMDSGLYRELKLGRSSMQPDPNKAEEARAKVDGKDTTSTQNIDDMRNIFEVEMLLTVTAEMAAVLQVEQEDELRPYVLTIDEQSKDVLAMYRNWEEDDEGFEAIQHIFEFPFIRWDGAFAIGLPHIIGSLSGAATGALRALLDSAHIANTQGGLILKGSGAGGQTRTANFGEFTEVDGGLETDDIRKKIMPFAAQQPSTVLFQLLGFCVDAMKSAVRTSMDDTTVDTNTNVPVGTQLSRVEEGLVVFSAIHGRAHAAFDRFLAGLHRLNRMYMPETIRVDLAGKEIIARRKDFEGPCDIQPVSEPTIYSDQQRMAQISAIQARADTRPGLYDPQAVEKRFLTLLKVSDFDELLVKQPTPEEMNAVNENMALAMGRPVVAFPDQNHLAHMQSHLDFASSPMLGGNPIFAAKFLPGFIQHIGEHILFQYVVSTTDLITHAAGMEAADLMSSDSQVKDRFDALLAMAGRHVVPEMQSLLQGAMPIIQQAMQHMQAMMPKPPMDPAAAATAAAQAETARKAQNDKATGALNQQKNAIMAQRNQDTVAIANERNRTDMLKTLLDTNTARDIASSRIASGRQAGFSDGSSIG